MSQQIGNRIYIDVFAQLFANHADWCGTAARQTFDKFDTVIPVGTDGNGIVHCIVVGRAADTKGRAQVFHQLKTTGHCATECATDANMSFAGRLLSKHWIEGDELENVNRLQTELFRDPRYGLVADEPEVFLPQMQ